MHVSIYWLLLVVIIVGGVAVFLNRGEEFEVPRGETVRLEESGDARGDARDDAAEALPDAEHAERPKSNREIFVTDGVKHSISLGEILSGGPPKDGIPSIDNPQFISTSEANAFLSDEDVGLGLVHGGDARFYPYQILVWHEIVNDIVGGDPLLVTYCPLCATGIVFGRTLVGVPTEFGVSGRLWRSNLLMYNRASDTGEESLWSQVLGEAVLGVHTGERLPIVPSDTVRYGEWKRKYPETNVLSRETGASRSYGRDPYGNYYTSDSVSFGATFNDDRLHPKAYVFGVEVNGEFKAYHGDALPIGMTTDVFAERAVTIEKSDIGEVRMSIDGNTLPHIGGFWFSWLAAHPETELFSK